MPSLKKMFLFLAVIIVIITMAAPVLLYAQEVTAEGEPWWFFSLELAGIVMITYIVVAFILKLPGKNLPAQKEKRKLFINIIIGLIFFGVALLTRAYFEIVKTEDFKSAAVFEIWLYLSLLAFIYGISKYQIEE